MRPLAIVSVAPLIFGAAAFPDDSSSPKPDATVRLTEGSIAAGVGYEWGHGRLVYQGKTYRFSVSGVSLLDVGASDLSAFGGVYNLHKLSDVNGTYLGPSEALAVAEGTTGLSVRNEHGVVMKLVAATKGLRLNLGASGMHVTLQN